ncbi:MAG TPA: helix-hairpin-helix domain-containing protein [Hanamia sp.]|nr:helix-hairpin-helix domain-containing protein [Hanamia sp.]
MWKQFVKEYLSFTRKERWGIISVVLLILFFTILPFFYPYFIKKEMADGTAFEKEMARLRIDSSGKKNYTKNFDNEYYNDYSPNVKYVSKKIETFTFDPNTATATDWIRLGVREKTASTIQKYISKGGRFYKPEDIKKIWGLSKTDVQRLLPYVSIKNVAREYPQFKKKEFAKNSTSYAPKVIQKINVNLADTSAFIALPGIGSKLSKRIISFRDKLGGFYSVEQVAETYLLPDSTFQKIKSYLFVSNSSIKRININTASVDEMKAHPYIKYNMANAIFQYRQQHGNYVNVEQIKKIMIITDEMYQKAAPYFSVE